MEHMEEGEETIKFKEALEPESEIEEDSSDKEDSVTNEGTESVKGTFFFLFYIRIIGFQCSYHHTILLNGTIHFTIHSTFWPA